MNQKKFGIGFFLLLILPLVLSTFNINPVSAQATRVYIDPPSLVDTGLVVGQRFNVSINVENVVSLRAFEFEMSFNPDVVNGIWAKPPPATNPEPVYVRNLFLTSAGGSIFVLPGSGWNNTLGKLWLTSATLFNPIVSKCPSGTGTFAKVTFEVVGLGETELHLENAALKDFNEATIPITVDSGYFRNVDSASIPTASFTTTPVGTPEPMEGFNTTFTDTSIPAAGATIVTRKWYFWADLTGRPVVPHLELDGPIVEGSVIDHNYTGLGVSKPGRGTWPLTLTVIDNMGVVASTTQNVVIKAHDVYFTGIYTNATIARYPSDALAIDIDKILEIKAEAVNKGNFTETFNVTTFWTAFYSDLVQTRSGAIGTQTGITLAPGQKMNVTFYWNTAGRNITHPDTFAIHANASRVPYEYAIQWADGKLAPNEFVSRPIRVKHHDIAITSVTTNATRIEPGQVVRVSVTILNQGDFNESDLTVAAYYDSVLIDTFHIAQMANQTFSIQALQNTNYTRTIAFNWTITDLPPHAYTVKATVTTVPNEYDTSDNTYTDGKVGTPPVADFTYTPSVPIANEIVDFDASNSYALRAAYILSYRWNFGDGNVTTVPNTNKTIKHVYKNRGTYTVILTVTDNDTLTDDHSVQVTVIGHDVGVTNIEVSATHVTVGNSISINVTVKNQGDFSETFDVTIYANTTSIETKTVTDLAAGAETTLVFNWDTTGFTIGVYIINATASTVPGETNPADNTRTYTENITIAQLEPPVASFTYSPASPSVDTAVTFDASTSSDADGTIVSYSWNFGDGSSGSGVTVTHSYTAAGTFEVTLTVTDNDGLTDTETKTVVVLPPSQEEVHDVAVVDITVSKTEAYIGAMIYINVTVSNKGTKPESFNVTVYYGDSAIATRLVVNLAPDATKELVFTWGTLGLSEGNYAISARIPQIPGETDIDDNTRSGGTVSLQTSGAPPFELPSFPLYGFAAIVSLIMAAIVVVVYFLRFRK